MNNKLTCTEVPCIYYVSVSPVYKHLLEYPPPVAPAARISVTLNSDFPMANLRPEVARTNHLPLGVTPHGVGRQGDIFCSLAETSPSPGSRQGGVSRTWRTAPGSRLWRSTSPSLGTVMGMYSLTRTSSSWTRTTTNAARTWT